LQQATVLGEAQVRWLLQVVRLLLMVMFAAQDADPLQVIYGAYTKFFLPL